MLRSRRSKIVEEELNNVFITCDLKGQQSISSILSGRLDMLLVIRK
jgi:hypothetical protein